MQKKIQLTKKTLKKLLPIRSTSSHKGDGGHVVIIGGAKGLLGAGILSALAATRAGAGYTHLVTDLQKFPWLKFPDFIVHKLAVSSLKNIKPDSLGIGPGLGVGERTRVFLKYLVASHLSKVVIDADMLNQLALDNTKLPAGWILTPHEGELARLMNVTAKDIRSRRLYWTIKAQEKFGCIILLKGAETLIADQSRYCIIKTGTPALAKAGTGDVLLGIVTAFNAQVDDHFYAAALGAYVHGQASRDWIKEGNDVISLRPLDLIEHLPKTIFHLRS